MQTTETPRTEFPSRAASILAGYVVLALMVIVVLFVAGVLGIGLVWLARAALGG